MVLKTDEAHDLALLRIEGEPLPDVMLLDRDDNEVATSELLVFWIAFGFVLNGLFQINVYAYHLTLRTGLLSLILLAAAAVLLAIVVTRQSREA